MWACVKKRWGTVYIHSVPIPTDQLVQHFSSVFAPKSIPPVLAPIPDMTPPPNLQHLVGPGTNMCSLRSLFNVAPSITSNDWIVRGPQLWPPQTSAYCKHPCFLGTCKNLRERGVWGRGLSMYVASGVHGGGPCFLQITCKPWIEPLKLR
jgi:hypothetical protein